MDLVIMSAGLGSRFGGLKQIEPVDEDGNYIIDYLVYDAVRCGIKKVIFIIKENNYEIFKETIGARVDKKIQVCYAFQENPENIKREKPLGTGHAVLCSKEYADEKFIVVNADDFYGPDTVSVIKSELENDDENFVMMGYKLKNTMPKTGKVKRGICSVIKTELNNCIESSKNLDFQSKNAISKTEKINQLSSSVSAECISKSVTPDSAECISKSVTPDSAECISKFVTPDSAECISKIDECEIEKIGDTYLAIKLSDGKSVECNGNTIVSMNMFGFNKKIFDFLENDFKSFLSNPENIKSGELFLPNTVTKSVYENKVKVRVIPTDAEWSGITYREDLISVRERIAKLKRDGKYPLHLWK